MILIDDFYNFWEIGQIWSELKELEEKDIFLDPHESWSAVKSGKLLKNNKCIHLDEYYQENRNNSKIMRINRKIFEKNVFESNKSFFFRDFMPMCDFDATLLHIMRIVTIMIHIKTLQWLQVYVGSFKSLKGLLEGNYCSLNIRYI